MDRNLDFETYNELDHQLRWEDDRMSQRKIIHTRIMKLSAKKSCYSSADIGKISFQSGQFQKSLIQLKRATIIDPQNKYIQVSLGEALLELEKEEEGFSYLKKVMCVEPCSWSAHDAVVRRFQKRERLGDLENFYQEIVNSITDTKSIADLYFASAESLVSSNEYSKAFEMYQKSFKTYPMRSRHHYSYAVALYHEGLFEEAIVEFEYARDKDPRDKLSLNNIAHLHYCLGQLHKSLDEFEYILENGLQSAGTYPNFILLLYQLDKGEEVINDYRDLLQQNLGGNRGMLQAMYKESLRITRVLLERDDIDEKTREFNEKKIKGLNLVLSFLE